MLQQSEILAFLRANKPYLQQQFEVDSIGLFGSYARSTQSELSDIDLLVKLKRQDFILWSGLLNYLQQSFNCKIDLITAGNHLSSRFSKLVEKDIIYA